MKSIFLILLISFFASSYATDIGLEYDLGKTALKENRIALAKKHFYRCFEIIDSAKVFEKRINCHSIEYSYGDLNPKTFNKIYFWLAVCFKKEDKPLHTAILLEFAEDFNSEHIWSGNCAELYNKQSSLLKKWIKKKGESPCTGIEFPEGNHVIKLIQTNAFDDGLKDYKVIKNKEKYIINTFEDKLK